MAYDYIKSISGDFPNAEVSPGLLKYQIDNDGGVTTGLEYINTSGDDCTMNFVSEPSSGEKTAIDALITAHTTALIATWNDNNECCGPPVLTTAERDALFTVPAGTMIWNSTLEVIQEYDGASWKTAANKNIGVSLNLDFTGTEFDTKAECNAKGIQFSDADTPYPTTAYVQHAGTWSHVASSGWKPVTTDETKGPSLLFPIARSENWELEIVFNFDSADVSDTGQLILFAMTSSNHIAFFAMADDSHGSADQLVTSLFTNDGDDTYSSAYVGSGLAGTGQRTIKLRNLNGTYSVWDDEDDSWHDFEGRQDPGIPYSPIYLGLQARKGVNTMVRFEIENLKLTYL